MPVNWNTLKSKEGQVILGCCTGRRCRLQRRIQRRAGKQVKDLQFGHEGTLQ